MRLEAESMGIIWTPEIEAILGQESQEMIITGGYRAGKSLVTALKIWFHPKFKEGGGLFWIVGPQYALTQAESDYLFQWCIERDWIKGKASMPLADPRRIELINGTIIETRSSDSPERLASAAPDFLAVVEAGQQFPTVRDAVLGRALQKDAQILYSGTMQEEKQAFTWFIDLAQNEHELPDGTVTRVNDYYRSSFRLPSWANRKEFPGGFNDPKIQRHYLNYKAKGDLYTFDRQYGGVPSGVRFPVYPQLNYDTSRLRECPPQTEWITNIGGSDFGTVHPSALVVVGLSTERLYVVGGPEKLYEHHLAWVREVWWDGDRPESERGDPAIINFHKRRLSQKYGVRTWATDPNQRWQAKQWGGQAVSMGSGAREMRVGFTRSRLQNDTLLYDLKGEGVQELYEEQRLVRRQQMPDTSLQLVRRDDDRTAALEDAIELLDKGYGRPMPQVYRIERNSGFKIGNKLA